MNDGLSSTAIILSKGEAAFLAGDQEEGLKRGMILLSKLTFDWLSIAKGAGKSTATLGYKAYKLSGDSTAEEAAEEISGFLRRAWSRATHRIGEDDTIRSCSRLLGVSRTEIFSIARTSILNSDVIQELVPFYGSVKTVIKGAKGVYDTKKKFDSLDELRSLRAAVDSGFPTVAINGFIKYAKNEAVRSALKTAYNFGKGIAKVLVDIFAAPVSSVVNFVTAVVEAIVSFAYNLLQGALFAKAAERARVCVEERMVMTIEDFRKIIGGCPFVGAVFFAGAHYIKHFSLIRLLSNEQRVISTNSLTEGLIPSSVGSDSFMGFPSV